MSAPKYAAARIRLRLSNHLHISDLWPGDGTEVIVVGQQPNFKKALRTSATVNLLMGSEPRNASEPLIRERMAKFRDGHRTRMYCGRLCNGHRGAWLSSTYRESNIAPVLAFIWIAPLAFVVVFAATAILRLVREVSWRDISGGVRSGSFRSRWRTTALEG